MFCIYTYISPLSSMQLMQLKVNSGSDLFLTHTHTWPCPIFGES